MGESVKIKKAFANVELSDGRILHVRILNRSRIAGEFYGNKRKWTPPEEYSLVRTSYVIFEQLRLDAEIPADTKWDHFRDVLLVDFDMLDDDNEDAKEDVDPTPSAGTDTSASPSRPQPASTSTDSTEPTTTS